MAAKTYFFNSYMYMVLFLMNLHSPSKSNTIVHKFLVSFCYVCLYDWLFPHMYFAMNVTSNIFSLLIVGSVFSDCILNFGDTRISL